MLRKTLFAATLAALLQPALADEAQPVTARPVFNQLIPNIPGKSLVSVLVTYAPGGRSPSHRHAGSAFIFAYVLSGAIRSQVDDGSVTVYRAGESWFEAPGAHHRVSENASQSEPASLLAVFVVDSGEAPLTIPDHD
jgi:quercetin dioxygenase-like cupin family protein